ncbi:MAG: PIG-L deacetylase family protein [Bacteroidota bacterium]|nr:PIG-L deacetylase family protein [Bacteroidota bacterium]
MDKTVLAIFAHPDDAEIECSGTLSLLKKAGWNIHIATMAPGDKGTVEYNREEISRIRKAEAAEGAKVIGASYTCLEFEDVYIMYDRESINRTTSLLRKIKPSLVFTHNPADYMVDHETTSRIVMTACFSTGIKNLEIEEDYYEPIPYLYYTDAMDAKNILGQPILTSMFVDITSEMPIKEKMLACHASQRNWLLAHHKMDEYILSMKRFGEFRGKNINVKYAEGYRQHLGHGYPQDNILKEILGDKAVLVNK